MKRFQEKIFSSSYPFPNFKLPRFPPFPRGSLSPPPLRLYPPLALWVRWGYPGCLSALASPPPAYRRACSRDRVGESSYAANLHSPCVFPKPSPLCAPNYRSDRSIRRREASFLPSIYDFISSGVVFSRFLSRFRSSEPAWEYRAMSMIKAPSTGFYA